MFRFLSIGFLLAVLIACSDTVEKPSIPEVSTPTDLPQKEIPEFVQKIEKAHKKTDFLKKTAIQFDFVLYFRGKERLNGTMLLSTDSRKGLLQKNNGEQIFYKDDTVFYTPELENAKRVRFDAYTWSYFFLFPYKLSDEGTNWEDYPLDTLNDTTYLSQKLTFDAGTGDAPDDWYITYVDPVSELVQVAAYIVTASASKEEAEEDPHAIRYHDYTKIDGVPISTRWTFWSWKPQKGLYEQLGHAKLSKLQFVEPDPEVWTVPNEFKQAFN